MLGSVSFWHMRPLRSRVWSLLDSVVPGRVLCRAEIRLTPEPAAYLLLPPPEVLWREIVSFFSEEPRVGRLHSGTHPKTTGFKQSLNEWAAPAREPAEISLETAPGHADGVDCLRVFAGGRRRDVAIFIDGLLVVRDERDRSWITTQLGELGLVRGSAAPSAANHFPSEQPTNVDTRWSQRSIAFRSFRPWPENLEGGRFLPSSRTLCVEDRSLAPALTAHAERLGLQVAAVRWPMVPWTSQVQAEADVESDPPASPTRGRIADIRDGKYLAILETQRHLFEPTVLDMERVRWLTPDDVGSSLRA